MASGRAGEALIEMKRAAELDPLSMLINSDLTMAYLPLRRYDDALEQLRRNLEPDPTDFSTHAVMARTYILKGMYDEAVKEYQKMPDEQSLTRDVGLVQACALAGRRAEALKLFDELKDRPKEERFNFFYMALMQAALGEHDEALDSLEQAYKQHEQNLLYLKVEGRLDSLRSDPRFTDLMRRVGIPE